MKILFSRASGANRVSNLEVQGFGGNPALLNTIERIEQSMTEGKSLTEPDLGELRKFSQVLRAINTNRMNSIAEGHMQAFPLQYGMVLPPEVSREALLRYKGVSPNATSAPSAAPSSSPPLSRPKAKDYGSEVEYQTALQGYIDALKQR